MIISAHHARASMLNVGLGAGRDGRDAVRLQLADQLQGRARGGTQFNVNIALHTVAKNAREHAALTARSNLEEVIPGCRRNAVDGEKNVAVSDTRFSGGATVETSENRETTEDGGEAGQICLAQHTSECTRAARWTTQADVGGFDIAVPQYARAAMKIPCDLAASGRSVEGSPADEFYVERVDATDLPCT